MHTLSSNNNNLEFVHFTSFDYQVCTFQRSCSHIVQSDNYPVRRRVKCLDLVYIMYMCVVKNKVVTVLLLDNRHKIPLCRLVLEFVFLKKVLKSGESSVECYSMGF